MDVAAGQYSSNHYDLYPSCPTAVRFSFISCAYLFLWCVFLSACTTNFYKKILVLFTFTFLPFFLPTTCGRGVVLQTSSGIIFLIELFAFISNSILLLLASWLGHLTHNRGVPCTDDLPRRQMLLLNSRLSLPSSHVLPQVVRHCPHLKQQMLSLPSSHALPQVVQYRSFKNGKCCSLTASCPLQSVHFNIFCPRSPCVLFSLNYVRNQGMGFLWQN